MRNKDLVIRELERIEASLVRIDQAVKRNEGGDVIFKELNKIDQRISDVKSEINREV